MKKWTLLCLAALMAVNLSAQTTSTKVMVISDLHLMPQSLIMESSDFSSDPKLVEHSQNLLDSAIAQVLAEQPDILLIPGDLSHDGEAAAHNYVHTRLQEVLNAGIAVYVVPGNHDIANCADSISASDFKTLYADCGYADAVLTDSLHYMAYPNEHLALICMNSCQSNQPNHKSAGGLLAADIQWLDSAAAQALRSGRLPMLMMHHPVLEHFDGHGDFSPTYLANQEAQYPSLDSLQAHIIRAGIPVAFTGHYHIHSIQHVTTDEGELWDVLTGSTCSYPMPIRTLTLTHDAAANTLTMSGLTSRLDTTLLPVALARNGNTAKGAMNSMAKKLFPIVSDMRTKLAGMAGFVNLPKDEAGLVTAMSTYMLAPYTQMINSLSAGDEDQDPNSEAYNEACKQGLENYMRSVANNSDTFYNILMGVANRIDTFVTYKEANERITASVFGNYVETETNVVPDAEMNLTFPAPVALPSALDETGADTKTARILLENGQLYIQRDGQLFTLTGSKL